MADRNPGSGGKEVKTCKYEPAGEDPAGSIPLEARFRERASRFPLLSTLFTKPIFYGFGYGKYGTQQALG